MHVGVDLVEVPSFAEQFSSPGSTFASVFSGRELRACVDKPDRLASLAARWAAKEAFIKAWSQSRYGAPDVMDPSEIDFADIEVVSDAFGRVALVLRGTLGKLAPTPHSLSLSHDGDYAVAVCVVE